MSFEEPRQNIVPDVLFEDQLILRSLCIERTPV